MELRRATTLDFHHIIRLRTEFLKEIASREDELNEVKLSIELLNYLKQHLNHDFVNWLAQEGDQVIATGGICFHDYPPSFEILHPTRAYIMNIYTLPEYRGKCIGKIILDKLLEEARNRKVRTITLHTTEKAKSLYDEFGFHSKENEMVLTV